MLVLDASTIKMNLIEVFVTYPYTLCCSVEYRIPKYKSRGGSVVLTVGATRLFELFNFSSKNVEE